MAKLTARFDMEDKISKKLKTISGNMDSVEKKRKALDKPITLKANDQATKILKPVFEFVKRDLAKKYTMSIDVDDRATKQLTRLSSFMKKHLPRSHQIIVEALDKTRSVLNNLATTLTKKFGKAVIITIIASDMATPLINKVSNFAKKAFGAGYNFTIKAIDAATKVVSRVAGFAKSAIPATLKFAIKAADHATNVISKVKKALFSIPSVVTVTLAVVGLGKLSDVTLGSAMKFEEYETAMTHWLDGNTKKAKELMGWMGEFADTTPFSSADLFPALAQGVGLSSGDVAGAQRLLKISADMAALTPGKTVFDAMQALSSAQMNNFVMMQAFGKNISQDEFAKMGGWDGFLNDVENHFLDGAKKFSLTSSGIIATLRGYASSMLRNAGQGFLEPLKPRLNGINLWLADNQEAWGRWRDTVKDLATEASEWLLTKMESAFDYLRVTFLDNDEFISLDFGGKMSFIGDELRNWWSTSGRPIADTIAVEFGKIMWTGLSTAIKEGFKSIGHMWADVFKNPSLGGFGGASIASLLGVKFLSPILKPLSKLMGSRGFSTTISATLGKASSNFKKIFESTPAIFKGISKKTAGVFKNVKLPPGVSKGVTKVITPLKKMPLLGTALGALTIANASSDEKGSAVGKVGGSFAGAKAGGLIGTTIFPGVGTVVGSIAGALTGAFGGSKLGGWLQDSFWGDIKSNAADAADWIGTKFDQTKDKISDTLFNGAWWNDNWQSVKGWTQEKWDGFQSIWGSITDKIGETLFSGEWWSDKWDGVKNITSNTIFNAEWWAEKAGYIYGYLESTMFNSEWWIGHWETVKGWTEGTIFDGAWWNEKWQGVKDWTQEKWDGFTDIWESIKTRIGETIFNGEWWSGHWEKVKDWTREKWEGFTDIWESIKTRINETIFSSEWWNEKWQGVKDWTQEKWDGFKDVWESIKTRIGETIFNGEWWSEKWQGVQGWTQEKWDGFQSVWDSVATKINDTLFNKEWWTSRWEKVKGWTSGVAGAFQTGREKGQNAAAYANGGFINRPHLGLVGEAGREVIIPLSKNKNSRAMDLYEKTGRMLGVQPYADGGFAGGGQSMPEPLRLPASNPVSKTVEYKVEVNIQGDNHFNQESDMDMFVDKVKKTLVQILSEEHHEGGDLIIHG